MSDSWGLSRLRKTIRTAQRGAPRCRQVFSWRNIHDGRFSPPNKGHHWLSQGTLLRWFIWSLWIWISDRCIFANKPTMSPQEIGNFVETFFLRFGKSNNLSIDSSWKYSSRNFSNRFTYDIILNRQYHASPKNQWPGQFEVQPHKASSRNRYKSNILRPSAFLFEFVMPMWQLHKVVNRWDLSELWKKG